MPIKVAVCGGKKCMPHTLHRHGFEKGVVDAFVPAHPGPVALVHTHTRTHVLFLLTCLIFEEATFTAQFSLPSFFSCPV